jgi:hypothetical protein
MNALYLEGVRSAVFSLALMVRSCGSAAQGI